MSNFSSKNKVSCSIQTNDILSHDVKDFKVLNKFLVLNKIPKPLKIKRTIKTARSEVNSIPLKNNVVSVKKETPNNNSKIKKIKTKSFIGRYLQLKTFKNSMAIRGNLDKRIRMNRSADLNIKANSSKLTIKDKQNEIINNASLDLNILRIKRIKNMSRSLENLSKTK